MNIDNAINHIDKRGSIGLFSMETHEVSKGDFRADVKLKSNDGTEINFSGSTIRVTNRFLQIVSRPATYTVRGKGDRTVSGFKIPILHAQPHKFVQPWFGPYKWETRISGPAPEGIEPQNGMWSMYLTFSSGGAFEYRIAFLKSYGAAAQAAQEGMEETLPAYSEFA